MTRCVDAHTEAKFAAQSFEAVDACFGLIAEAEVFAFVQLGDVQGLLEDFCGEGARGHVGEFGGEGNDQDCVDACFCEQLQFLRKRCDERLNRFGPYYSRRVGIEGDGDGWDVQGACLGYDFGDNPLMSVVDTVEVADGGDGWTEV